MAEKILIIDDDLDTLRLVGLMLQRQGYQIVAAADGKQGLSQADSERPDLILLDIMMPAIDGYEVARQLRANPDTADIPILIFTAKTQLNDKVTGFEAGADDYLTKPTHPSELQAHVKALLARSVKGRAAAPVSAEKRAYTVGVLAARGGLGVTTLAVNLGSSLYAETKEEVIVAELRPGQGTLGPDLGEPNPQGLTELLKTNPVEITRQKVREQLVLHESNLQLLLASNQPRDAQLVTAFAQFEAILNRLIYLARYVVLDFGPGFSPLTQKLINICDQIVVIVEPVPHSIDHAKALLADLREFDIAEKDITAVGVNRVRSDTQMNWTQVQDRLEHPVVLAFTPAPELIYQATRLKSVPVIYQPDTLTSQQFAKLASLIIERARLEQ